MKDFTLNKEEIWTAFVLVMGYVVGGIIGIVGGIWLFS